MDPPTLFCQDNGLTAGTVSTSEGALSTHESGVGCDVAEVREGWAVGCACGWVGQINTSCGC